MLLTIIVPAHNEQACIGRCLASLTQQGETRFQLIVVDNASTDGTAAIARSYVGQVVFEGQKGYHHAVRRGVREARGDLLAVCDADTVYPRDWVATVYREMRPGLAGIYGAVDFHDGRPLFRWLCRFVCFTLFMRLMLPFGAHVCNGFNFVFRKDAYEQVGGYDPRIYNRAGLDINLGQRLKEVGPLKFVPRLKTYTSLRRIVDGGLGRFLSVNLTLYLAIILKREVKTSYQEYNRR